MIWREFLAARDDNLTRSIGVSNYGTGQIDELIQATGEAPAVNQIPWSPCALRPAPAGRAPRRGIVLEGYSPFKCSDLSDPVLAASPPRTG